jgi:hypothetical protein
MEMMHMKLSEETKKLILRLNFESGIACTDRLSVIHEEAERLLGHAIWLHELVGMELEFKIALVAKDEGLFYYKPRQHHPLATLMRQYPDKAIIMLTKD